MLSIKNLRGFLISWNNTFVLDKSFRVENKIAFNSPEHRATCQIDIYLQYLEDKLFEEHTKTNIEDAEKLNKYHKGEWISPRKMNDEELTDAYDKIDINFLQVDEQ